MGVNLRKLREIVQKTLACCSLRGLTGRKARDPQVAGGNKLQVADVFSLLYTKLKEPGFPGGSEVKASACNAGDVGSIPRLGRSPGKENGNPLQYSCLENPVDRGAWWATVHGVTKGRTRLSDFTFTFF